MTTHVQSVGIFDPDIKGCYSEVAMLSFRFWFWSLKVSILLLLRMQMVAFFCFSSPVSLCKGQHELNELCQGEQNKLAFNIR